MDNGNGSRFVSFRVVVGSLSAILVLLVTGVVTDTRTSISEAKGKIECLQRDKVDLERYKEDMGEIKQSLRDINYKLDVLKAR